jgi:short subunit dehydrogenase-like uncharacterized protein
VSFTGALLQEAKLPERYGILTPASAMGSVLTERLCAHGMTTVFLQGRLPRRLLLPAAIPHLVL